MDSTYRPKNSSLDGQLQEQRRLSVCSTSSEICPLLLIASQIVEGKMKNDDILGNLFDLSG
jgi:hypothetical protein